MSQYDDDADRLSEVCDNCGEMMHDCTCDDDYPSDDQDADIGGER